jgi:hypothetical protein
LIPIVSQFFSQPPKTKVIYAWISRGDRDAPVKQIRCFAGSVEPCARPGPFQLPRSSGHRPSGRWPFAGIQLPVLDNQLQHLLPFVVQELVVGLTPVGSDRVQNRHCVRQEDGIVWLRRTCDKRPGLRLVGQPPRSQRILGCWIPKLGPDKTTNVLQVLQNRFTAEIVHHFLQNR